MNGYTPEIDTPEKRAAQLAQDVRHYTAVRDGYKIFSRSVCDCKACQRVCKAWDDEDEAQSVEAACIVEWLDGWQDDAECTAIERLDRAEFASGLVRDGEDTGISQRVIF